MKEPDFSLQKALDKMKKGDISPVYLIYGDDDYSVGASLGKIISTILPEPSEGLNLISLDGEGSYRALCEEILTPSLLGGRKIVVVRNTELFQSKTSPGDFFKKAASAFENDPGRALKFFQKFLKAAGLDIEDVARGNWKNIAESDWKKMLGDNYPEYFNFVPVLSGLIPERREEDAENSGGADDFSDVLKAGIPEGNCLILTADSVDQRKSLYKYILENGIIINHAAPKYEKGRMVSFGNLVREAVEQRGGKITAEAIRVLGKKTANDIRLALSEIEKIISYIGENPTIDDKDVEYISGKSISDPGFKLNSCVQEKDLRGSLEVLGEMLGKSEPPLKIMAMLVRELRLLLQAKIILNSRILETFKLGMDYSSFQNRTYPEIKSCRQDGRIMAEIGGQHPYVIYSAFRNSTRFSYEKLLKDLDYLLDMDVKFKSTGIDQKTALESALIRVCS